MHIAILALQGNFIQHYKCLQLLSQNTNIKKLNIHTYFIKSAEDCSPVPDALILPGGESSTMAHLLLNDKKLLKTLQKYIFINKIPTLATCAGVILLAKKLKESTQNYMPNILAHPIDGINVGVDICVYRNGYGRQIQSFTAAVKTSISLKNTMKGLFIRAPIIISSEKNVKVLATYKNDNVIVEQECILLCTFHPETIGETTLHEYFLQKHLH